MSKPAYVWAVQEVTSGISPTSKMVLLALANDANDNGLSCFPSLTRIARHANMSVGNVRYHLRKLEAEGLIVVQRPARPAPGRSSRYALRMWRTLEATAIALKREVDELREMMTLKARNAAARVEGTVRRASYRLREEPGRTARPGSRLPLTHEPISIENSRFPAGRVSSPEAVMSMAESLASARSVLRTATPRRRW